MGNNDDGDTILASKSQSKTEKPPLYKILLLNDDFTPMEFVASIIQKVFNKTQDDATRIMLQIHTEGIGICGMYPFEIAETKMNQVLNLAKESQHPLQCIIEKI